MADSQKTLGIYVHVPFCRKKCEYCDFYSQGGSIPSETGDAYVEAVCRHLAETGARVPGRKVDTIYFGGGTPTYLGRWGLCRILDEIFRRFDVRPEAEITFEANPDSADARLLRQLRRAGFNRVSLGVQSDKNEILRALGRPHTFPRARQAVEDARKAGFDNLSVDLMYGLPGQKRSTWSETLESILALEPEHISAYALTIMEGTPLASYVDCITLPDDDTQADMYLEMVHTLTDRGYVQYEISNLARPGRECRHNLAYWTDGEYLGFGPAASSYYGGLRFTCKPDLQSYIDCILHAQGELFSENVEIPRGECATEYLTLRLRTVRGINHREYAAFGLPFAPLEEELRRMEQQGLAERAKDRSWHLTPEGFLVSNSLIVRLLELQEASALTT